jgi:hypothetical protein
MLKVVLLVYTAKAVFIVKEVIGTEEYGLAIVFGLEIQRSLLLQLQP